MKNDNILRRYPVLGEKSIVEELTLSEEQYRMIDERREAHLSGESKSFTWEQVKQNARNGS